MLRYHFFAPLLSFANPAALWALLGLLVPLAIHLWNRQPGRVVPVGALRWLTAGANRRMRRLHLTQWPLLLLRLALVAALALTAAAPRWQLPPQPVRPVVLISPEVPASPAWPLLRPTIDSLRRRGAGLRVFGPGFPLLTDSLAITRIRPSRSDSTVTTDAFWPRAAEAADSFPARPLYLFTSAGLAHFAGSRPALPARLHWQLVPADSATQTWLLAAARSGPDSLRLTIGRGDAAGALFRRQHVTWPRQPLTLPGLPTLRVQPRGAGFLLLPADSGAAPVPVARPLRVGIGSDDTRRPDLRYLRAALQAAAPALPAGLALRARPASAAQQLAADSLDWLLWLTDAPLPAVLRRQQAAGLRVLTDAPAPGQAAPVAFVFDEASGTASRLLRRGGTPAAGATTLWADAAGRPVLTQTFLGRGTAYQLHTRFHPQWSLLPDDGQLPALLLTLLAPPTPAGPEPRRLPTNQLTSRLAPGSEGVATHAQLDLRPWLALAAGLLFGLERLLVGRRSSSVAAV